MTQVVNVVAAPKGWREDPQYVDVRRAGRFGRIGTHPGTPGYFGNPYKVSGNGDGKGHERSEAVALFRAYAEDKIKRDPDYRKAVREIQGKTLVCCCKPLECHGDVLAELAERLASEVAA